jgi:pimeloyl-ACP methyl ester carboxylesterase
VSDPDWAFRADDAAVLDALASGAHAASLRIYFGASSYEALAQLAARSDRTPRHGAQVLVLPGIMGSKLGSAVPQRSHADLVWFDPATIGRGGLVDLALPGGSRLGPRGVMLFGYARLQLELLHHGFDVAMHPFDWRLGLEETGRALAARISAAGSPVMLVGHSMGGLVARMATALLPEHLVHRLVLLGTPNFGSFAAVQALRGTYAFVRKISRLDRGHSPGFFARRVFRSFPGLHQLLPAGGMRGIPDLCRPQRWPASGPQPDADLLAAVAAVRSRLAPPDGRMVQIAGVNQPTVTGLRRRSGGFDYHMGWRGDGTVPLDHALLPGLATYFVNELHARLPGNGNVISGIIDLLRSGETRALPRRWRSRVESLPGTDDAALQRLGRGKIDWESLDARTREAVMADLNS